jgi:WD40 repeat protein
MFKMTRRDVLQTLVASSFLGGSLAHANPEGGEAGHPKRLDWSSEVIPLATHSSTEPAPVVTGLSLQPMGPRLALAGDDNRVRICNRDTGNLIHLLQGHEQWVRCLEFTPGGHFLLTAGYDRRLLKWDANTGEFQSDVIQTSFPITSMCLDADSQVAALVGFSGKVCWIDWVEERCMGESELACQDLRTVAFSPGGKLLMTGGRDGVLYGFDTSTRKLVIKKPLHQRRIRDLMFSADGAWILSCGEDTVIHATHLQDDEQSFSLRSEHAKVLTVEWLSDGLFATAGTDNAIAIWDLTQRALVGHLIGHDGTVTCLAYDGNRLYSAGYDTTLRIWNANPKFAGRPETGVRVSREKLPGTSLSQ